MKFFIKCAILKRYLVNNRRKEGFMLAIVFQTAYIADIVFLALTVAFMIIDARRGFISVFFSFVSTVVLALFFAAQFQQSTDGLFGFESAAAGWIGEGLSKISPFNLDISAEGIEAQISTLALPEFIKEAVLKEITAVTPEVAAGTLLGQYVGVILSQYLVLFLCGLLLFFGVKLVMRILRKLLTRMAESVYLFRKINRLGGMFVGLLKGLALTCVVLAIVALIPNENLHAFFDQTMILTGFYNKNPIHLILSSFIG